MDPNQDYDAVIFRACPNYAISLERAASLVLPDTRNLVSLGTGTGNLEAAVFDKISEVRIRGYERNSNYLKIATQKLGCRFLGVRADITQVNLSPSEGVISSLTLHHIADKDKENIFRRIYGSLIAGGRFVNYDIVKAKSDEQHKDFVDYVTGHMKSQGFSSDFIEEETRILNGIGEGADIPMTLENQQRFLEDLGFTFRIDWIDHLFVIYHCDKNQERI